MFWDSLLCDVEHDSIIVWTIQRATHGSLSEPSLSVTTSGWARVCHLTENFRERQRGRWIGGKFPNPWGAFRNETTFFGCINEIKWSVFTGCPGTLQTICIWHIRDMLCWSVGCYCICHAAHFKLLLPEHNFWQKLRQPAAADSGKLRCEIRIHISINLSHLGIFCVCVYVTEVVEWRKNTILLIKL